MNKQEIIIKYLIAVITSLFILLLLCFLSAATYEISGSPFDTRDAPLPLLYKTHEKLILVDPVAHVWGAYNQKGKLIRWGIATAGAAHCKDSRSSCLTAPGIYRIYSLGGEGCYSKKYHNAPMPYCMFFNGSEALHGSTEIQFANESHGCVRVHIDDAKWLRFHFVEGPTEQNHHQGTLVIIKPYYSAWRTMLDDTYRKILGHYVGWNNLCIVS